MQGPVGCMGVYEGYMRGLLFKGATRLLKAALTNHSTLGLCATSSTVQDLMKSVADLLKKKRPATRGIPCSRKGVGQV